MKAKKIIDSFNYAFEGIIYTIRTQRNMRIHLLIGILVLLLSLFYDLSKFEILVLFLTISLVIVTEMINTAIESTIDLITDEYHELAKIAKNVAAGAVLISAINSIIVAYIIFYDKINEISGIVFKHVKSDPLHITFISLIIVIFLSISMKAYFKKGTPLRGGLPSGHAAISFSMVVAIIFISENVLIGTLSFLMALLVVQSRIESGIHSLYQVFIGALLGILVTLIIFQIIY